MRDKNYVKVKVDISETNKRCRQICLGGIDKNDDDTIDKNVQYNNTSNINNTSINIKEINNNKLLFTKKSFEKPSLDEVKQYCLERKNSIDAEKFIDYYDSNGWKIGRNPMKDWKAAIRTWEKNQQEKADNIRTYQSKVIEEQNAVKERFLKGETI